MVYNRNIRMTFHSFEYLYDQVTNFQSLLESIESYQFGIERMSEVQIILNHTEQLVESLRLNILKNLYESKSEQKLTF